MTRIVSGIWSLVLFCSFSGHSQDSLQIPSGPVFLEKIYLRTDREHYLSGETLWWKAYYTNGVTQQPDSLSKVLYVELVDERRKPVLQEKSVLLSAGANGSFFLPGDLRSGEYVLRAYTRWMKRLGSGTFFRKKIQVLNAMRPEKIRPDSTLNASSVRFFPEGGQMLAGVAGRVAVLVTDGRGRPVLFRGSILAGGADTVANFTGNKNGTADFTITIDKLKKYSAVIVSDLGKTVTLPFTPAENGVALSVGPSGTDEVTADVYSRDPLSTVAELRVNCRTVPVYHAPLVFQSGHAALTIKHSALGEGVNRFTILTSDGKELASRNYFIRPKHHLPIAVSTDATGYGQRKKVIVQLQTGAKGTKSPVDMSVSIYRADDGEDLADIYSFLWYKSDLNTTLVSAASDLDSSAKAAHFIDNVMLTDSPIIQKITRPLTDTVGQLPEVDGHLITGTAKNFSGQPVAGLLLNLAIPSSKANFFASGTGRDGRFWFDIRNYYGPGRIYIQARDAMTTDYSLSIDNPFWVDSIKSPSKITNGISVNLDSAETRDAIGVQVQNIYWPPQQVLTNNMITDTTGFYGRHYIQYNLDDYVRFATMEEVLREYVPEVDVRKRGNKYEFFVLEPAVRAFMSVKPLLLIDGVAVSENDVIQYDALKVKSLRIVPYNYHFGPFFYGGVISLITYAGAAAEVKTAAKSVVQDYDGFHQPVPFSSPDYSLAIQQESRKPDFRNLLYWNPQLITDSSGKVTISLYTGDLPGKYIVVAEGLDVQGNAGKGISYFEVR